MELILCYLNMKEKPEKISYKYPFFVTCYCSIINFILWICSLYTSVHIHILPEPSKTKFFDTMWKHEKIENCEKYAEEHNISISSNPDPSKSKSKCIYFTWWRDRKPGEVVLNHQKLPWVSQVDHLGHIIHESGSQDIDCKKARGAYIGSSTELLRNFHSPLQKLSAVQTYRCSF